MYESIKAVLKNVVHVVLFVTAPVWGIFYIWGKAFMGIWEAIGETLGKTY